MGDRISSIDLPVPHFTPTVTKPIRSKLLAAEKFPTMLNPPPGLNENVVGNWCRRVKFEIAKYFNEKTKVKYSQTINDYAAKNQKLEHDIYFLQKRVTELERENKTLRAANRAFNRALKTNIVAIDDENKIWKKEKKLKEVLCAAIRHVVDPSVAETLDKAAQDL